MTVQIAICDDMEDLRQCLRTYTEQYLKARGGSDAFEVDVFSHPDELLRACEKKKYHLFLLDILMPMINGIDSAREIQSENPSAFFVFCTSSGDYPIDAYELNAIHYLMKPIGFADFCIAMERFFSRLEAKAESCIRIPDLNGQITECMMKELMYIDVSGKYCSIHLFPGETVKIRSSIKKLEEELTAYPALYRMGGAYIVNLRAIRKIEGNKLFLKNREVLPIPRTSLPETRRRYIDYYNR